MTQRPTARALSQTTREPELPADSWEVSFLRHYEETLGNITEAARRTGIPRARVYARKANDRAFARAFRASQNALLDSLEAAVLQRARDGVEEPVYRGGEQIGTRRHFSDTLAQFILKSRKPEVYGGQGAQAQGAERFSVQEVLASWRASLGVASKEKVSLGPAPKAEKKAGGSA